MTQLAHRIAENLARIQEQIADAAGRSGRTASQITLVAVTKYVDLPTTLDVVHAGCTDLGESRPQRLWEKVAGTQSERPAWHLIGHLQRNKVDRTLPLVTLIHSVDSLRLLEAIDRSASRQGLPPAAVLLEVNTSGDESKHGWEPAEMRQVLATAAAFEHVRVQGLMTMAAGSRDIHEARRNFSALRDLRDVLCEEQTARVALEELSMGMSGDYAVAIEEGATIVRVGSAIFEGCGL